MKTLKNVLFINGTSSGVTGAVLIVFASSIAKLFGTPVAQAFWLVGIFLASFAALVLVEAIKDRPNSKIIRLIIALDISWVVASLIVVSFQLFDLSLIGYTLIAAVGSWVAAMAYFQINGVKHIPTA